MRNRHRNQADIAEKVKGLTTVSRRWFVETVAKGGGALTAVIFSEDALDGSVWVTTLAEECGLSVSHFARSFRRTNT